MSFAHRERLALVGTASAAGPQAPTLCEGWDVRALLAHLVIRERRPDAAVGIMVPRLAEHTERVQSATAQQPWQELLDEVASGPPWWSPMKPLDSLVNSAEMFIHHEDIRRAQPGWQPRILDDEDAESLRTAVKPMCRSLKKSGARVTLAEPDGSALVTVGEGPAVTVTGEVGELLLFVSGRDEVLVAFDGDEKAVAAVTSCQRGM